MRTASVDKIEQMDRSVLPARISNEMRENKEYQKENLICWDHLLVEVK